MEAKKIWESKTLWVNLIALGAILAQYVTGKELMNAESQMLILACINLVLRCITGKPIKW